METTFGHYTVILKKVVRKKGMKVLITTPKGIVCSFQVTVPKPLDFRVIYENVKVRTRHSRFDGFAYFLDLFKFIDYQISRLPFETVKCTCSLFSVDFSQKC